MLKHMFFSMMFSCLTLQAEQLLVAVLMVKNEALVMPTTLQPLIDAGIDSYFIYDTGSTDDTIEITQKIFAENNITHFVIIQEPFIDFATSRTKALRLTEQYFPHATFMLMLDAEWILHNGADLLTFCMEHKNDPAPIFYIHCKGINLDFCIARLIRCKQQICFVGKVHEIPNIVPQKTVPAHIYFKLMSTEHGTEKSKQRWLHDRQILLEAFDQNPTDARTVFFLGQTYFCCHDWQNAIKWLELRTTMSGWDEETFITFFILAQAYCELGNAEKMIYNYLKAFNLRPHRADPLIRLAEYYFSIKAYHLCYFFVKPTINMPYPSHDESLIEQWLYDFTRYDLLGKTAWLFKDYESGRQAVLKAFQACPELTYLQDNLAIYDALIKEQNNFSIKPTIT